MAYLSGWSKSSALRLISATHSRVMRLNASSIDGRVRFGRQLGRQKHRRPELRKRHVHGQRADDRASAGFVSEAIDERLQLARVLIGRGRRSVSQPATLAPRAAAPAIEAPPRTARDRLRRGTCPAAARRESAASDAARRRCARPEDRARAARAARVPLSIHSSIRCRYTISTTKVGASSPARPFSSGSSTAPRSATPGRIGRPPTFALHTVDAGGMRDLEEAALVVAHGVARLDEQAAVFRRERAIARLFDVGDEHRLRR